MKNRFKALFVLLLFLASSVFGDTLNSPLKNPSMAVTGTQRTATAITDYIIPVAVSGAACNSSIDIIAVTSDHSSQLVCQSGAWQPIGGSSGLGVGQTWQNVTGSRAVGGTYTNSTGKPIQIYIQSWGGTAWAVKLNGVSLGAAQSYNTNLFFVVPNGYTYSVTGSTLAYWYELR